MKRVFIISAAVFVLTAGFIELAISLNQNNSQDNAWKVNGVMSDACQCMLFCPCEFSSVPTFGHCDDAAILLIDSGHYGGLELDGLRVAVVSESPQGERLVDSVGRLKFARIYVEEHVSDKQAEALAFIARSVFGAFVTNAPRISEDEMVHRVKMDIEVTGNRHRITIPGVLELDLATVTGGDGKTPIVIQNSPFEEAGFGEAIIAQSSVYKYKNDAMGIDWDYGGRSASIRTFELQGELAD